MNTDLTTTKNSSLSHPLTIGQVANYVAAKHAFSDYRSRKAKQTLRRQDNDLALFTDYLAEVGIIAGDLGLNPDVWRAVTWGLVEGFVKWQLQAGYSVSSVNVRLSTVKGYAKLAIKAGTLDKTEYAMIRTVSGYSHKESKRIDEARQQIELATRKGHKKADAVSLTRDNAEKLKADLHDDNAQGRRDKLLMCLLLNHGLRVSEVTGLRVENFNLQEDTFTFYRPKVDKTQTHKLSRDTLESVRDYLLKDALPNGSLLRASLKSGKLGKAGMTDRAINKRVEALGEKLGIDNLSPHDCRHYAATNYAKTKDVKQLMEIFGWNSPAMAIRYIEDAKVIELDTSPI